MNPILNPFEELLAGLAENNIQFITVGGMACAFNDYVRPTEDVDIIINNDPQNVRKLLKFLSNYGEGFGSELTEKDFDDQEGAIRIIEEFPIDIFTVMGGRRYLDLLQFSQIIKVAGSEIPYLNAEGLVLLKKNSLREKDKIDVIQLTGRQKKT